MHRSDFSSTGAIFSALTSELTNDQWEPPLYLWITTMVTTISFFFQWISIIIGPEIFDPFPGRQADEWLEQTRGPDQGASCFFDLEKHGWVLQPRVSWTFWWPEKTVYFMENPMKSGWFGGNSILGDLQIGKMISLGFLLGIWPIMRTEWGYNDNYNGIIQLFWINYI